MGISYKSFRKLIYAIVFTVPFNVYALKDYESDFLNFFKIKDKKTKSRLNKIKKYVLDRKKELSKKHPKEAKFTIEEINIDLNLMDQGYNPYMMTRQEKVRAFNILKNDKKKKK